ncbi:hypothetical protein U91I_02790 [alpha proteobacterium U9-1i]|nr:hypothetical protein U91I_02790 [alpha proteobacterium U9-1i]
MSPIPAIASPWFNPKQAASYLGINPKMLSTLRIEGGGPIAKRMGKKLIRYHRDDLDNWVSASSKCARKSPH